MNTTQEKIYLTCLDSLQKSQANHLIKYLVRCSLLDCDLDSTDVTKYITDLYTVSVMLDDEEAENMGLSKTARELRKEWRFNCRQIKRTLKTAYRARLQYTEEWSKPRTKYIFDATGEVHNGFWYTLKACVSLKRHKVDCVRFRKYKR